LQAARVSFFRTSSSASRKLATEAASRLDGGIERLEKLDQRIERRIKFRGPRRQMADQRHLLRAELAEGTLKDLFPVGQEFLLVVRKV
jgi:hypothetical protein